ncbi:MAG: hypothetical protein OXU22_07420 [Gammaproteobacteria bacterium]|nr:hypothetical protein [Gammaproteobacteria bacterium]
MNKHLPRKRPRDVKSRLAEVDETLRKLVKLRKEMTLSDPDWKAMRDEGRRW